MRFQALGALAALLTLLGPARPAQATFLTWVQTLTDGKAGITGLTKTQGAVVSPDGNHVYVSGNDADTVVAFDRDPATGALTWLAASVNGVDGVDGLSYPSRLVISPDGASVYVACDDAVVVFARSAATGILTFLQAKKRNTEGISGLGSANSLALSPDGAYLYVVGTTTFSLTVFARNAATGALTYVEDHWEGGNGVTGMNFAQQVAISPDGDHVYVTGFNSNAIAVFDRNAATGKLTFATAVMDGANGVTGLAQPTGIAISQDGKHVYVTTFGTTLVVFTRDAATGALAWGETLTSGTNGVSGITRSFAVALSPDGSHVYASSAQDSAVATFERDPATGALTFVDALVRGLDFYSTNTIAQSPDGTNLYTTEYDVSTVGVFRLTSGPTTTSTSTVTTTTSAGATTTSTTLPGCGPSPIAGCRTAHASTLRLRAGDTPAGNRLGWRWSKGAATTLADFGDPTTTTAYRLCVYDHAATTPALVVEAAVPAAGLCHGDPCWRARRRGLRFHGDGVASDGITQIGLTPGRDGKAVIAVKGVGAALPFPAAPIAAPARVQLRASNGACFDASVDVVGKRARH
jgi:6-phosphogluconolactonase (cycloisomerase 2 family)